MECVRQGTILCLICYSFIDRSTTPLLIPVKWPSQRPKLGDRRTQNRPLSYKHRLVRNIPETFKGLGLSQQTAFCPQKAMLAGIVYQGLILNSQISKIYFDFTPNSIFTVSPSSIPLLIISSEFKLL